MHYSHSAAEHAADMYGTPIARTVFGFDSFLGLPPDDPAAHESFKGRCVRPDEEKRPEEERRTDKERKTDEERGAEEQGPEEEPVTHTGKAFTSHILTVTSLPSPRLALPAPYSHPQPHRRGVYADLINASVEFDGSGPSGSFSSGKCPCITMHHTPCLTR